MQVIDLTHVSLERRKYYVDTVFLDPSKDTTEDMWWCLNTLNRFPIDVRIGIINAPRLAVFVDDNEYPIYGVARQADGMLETFSTPLISRNKINFTKAFKRWMKTDAGSAFFRGSYSGLEWDDVNLTRLNWAFFLGFKVDCYILLSNILYEIVNRSGREKVVEKLRWWHRLTHRPTMMKLKYQEKELKLGVKNVICLNLRQ